MQREQENGENNIVNQQNREKMKKKYGEISKRKRRLLDKTDGERRRA